MAFTGLIPGQLNMDTIAILDEGARLALGACACGCVGSCALGCVGSCVRGFVRTWVPGS